MVLLLVVVQVAVALVSELFRALVFVRVVLAVVAVVVAAVVLLVALVLLRALVLLVVAPRVRSVFCCGCCCCFSGCSGQLARGSGARVGLVGLGAPERSRDFCFRELWFMWLYLFFLLVTCALFFSLRGRPYSAGTRAEPGRGEPSGVVVF